MVIFWMTLLKNKWPNIVMNDGRVHPLAWKVLPSLINNLWWSIIMDDQDLDKKSLGKWQYMQHYKSIIPQRIYKVWQINVRLTFSVGDTILWFKSSIEQKKNSQFVTLNIKISLIPLCNPGRWRSGKRNLGWLHFVRLVGTGCAVQRARLHVGRAWISTSMSPPNTSMLRLSSKVSPCKSEARSFRLSGPSLQHKSHDASHIVIGWYQWLLPLIRFSLSASGS